MNEQDKKRIEEIKAAMKMRPSDAKDLIIDTSIPWLMDLVVRQDAALEDAENRASAFFDMVNRLEADRDRLAARCEALEKAMRGNCIYCSHVWLPEQKCLLGYSAACDCINKGNKDWQFDEARFSKGGGE